jgi:NitT/TauT family transport system permease protein
MAVGSRVAPLAQRTVARRAYRGPGSAFWLGWLGIVLFVAAWELAGRAGLINPVIVSSPSRIAVALVAQCSSGQLLADFLVSMTELVVGFGLSLVVGAIVGIVMGLNRTVEYALDPFVWFLYSTPLVALYPLIVVWFGFGFATVIAITFMLTVVPIVVNTLAGVRSVDPSFVRAVRAFGGNDFDVVRNAIVPAAMPMVMAGVRIGLGRALIGVVLGEMFSSNAGLGYRMTVYGAHLRTADVFVPLLVFVAIGLVLTKLSTLVEDRLQAWKGDRR